MARIKIINAKKEIFMSTLTKEQVKQLVRGNDFQSVTDVSSYLKDIFKDIIQELLEAELETKLGYSKNDKEKKIRITAEMVTLQKLERVNLEKCRFKFQGIVNVKGKFELLFLICY